MLTKRVIPCLDVKDGRVVKGVNFVSLRDAGDPVELASTYDLEGADEVVFLDITATSDDRSTTVELASRAAEQLRIPYTTLFRSPSTRPRCATQDSSRQRRPPSEARRSSWR